MKPLHPTILVGYGRYGLHCLQALLAGAAARGELAWDNHPHIGSINEKRLSALALFWIPDVLGLEEQQAQAHDAIVGVAVHGPARGRGSFQLRQTAGGAREAVPILD